MAAKPLKIKNESIFHPNDMIQLNNFNDRLLKINKRENRENNNIYYSSYKINKPEHIFDNNEVILKYWNKIRFSSDVFIPNDVLLNFYSLVIVINHVIEKNDEFIPEIYINEGYFTKV